MVQHELGLSWTIGGKCERRSSVDVMGNLWFVGRQCDSVQVGAW